MVCAKLGKHLNTRSVNAWVANLNDGRAGRFQAALYTIELLIVIERSTDA